MYLRIIDAFKESNFEDYRCTERYWCPKIIVTQVVLCYVDVFHNPVIETVELLKITSLTKLFNTMNFSPNINISNIYCIIDSIYFRRIIFGNLQGRRLISRPPFRLK